MDWALQNILKCYSLLGEVSGVNCRFYYLYNVFGKGEIVGTPHSTIARSQAYSQEGD